MTRSRLAAAALATALTLVVAACDGGGPAPAPTPTAGFASPATPGTAPPPTAVAEARIATPPIATVTPTVAATVVATPTATAAVTATPTAAATVTAMAAATATPTVAATPVPTVTVTPTPAPTQAPVTEPRYGGTVTLGSHLINSATGRIPPFQVRTSVETSSIAVSNNIYNNLMIKDPFADSPPTTVEGHLAVEWSVSGDGTTITLKLREGVTWHDGADFSAEDVVHTVNAMLHPPQL